MKSLIFLSLALLSFSTMAASAASKGDVRREIRNLIEVLDQSNPSEKKLEEVMNLLKEAKTIMNDSDSSDSNFEACFDYTYAQYYRSLNSASATEKAAAACKAIGDLEVLKFSFEQAYRVLNSAAAMDLVSKLNTQKISGKLEMVKFAYEQYYRSVNASAAIENALSKSALARRDGLECLKRAFPEYYRSYNSSAAMDASFKACN